MFHALVVLGIYVVNNCAYTTPQVDRIFFLSFESVQIFRSNCIKHGARCKKCIGLFMLASQFPWQPTKWPPFRIKNDSFVIKTTSYRLKVS